MQDIPPLLHKFINLLIFIFEPSNNIGRFFLYNLNIGFEPQFSIPMTVTIDKYYIYEDRVYVLPNNGVQKKDIARGNTMPFYPRSTKSKKTTTVAKKTKPTAVKAPKPAGPHTIHPEENLTDNTEIVKFVIPGQPATKKTSQRIFRGRIMPSSQYCIYETYCKPFCEAAWIGKGQNPIDCGVVINMQVYLRNWQVGDATGYMQSIADIIQKYGVVTNDSWLHWDWEGKHWLAGIDKDNPRVEISIKRFRHPKEVFRADQEAEEAAKLLRAAARAEKAADKAAKETK